MPHLISPRGGAIPPRSKILQGKCAELTLWVMSYELWVMSMIYEMFWKHRDLRLPLDACWDITSTWVKTFLCKAKIIMVRQFAKDGHVIRGPSYLPSAVFCGLSSFLVNCHGAEHNTGAKFVIAWDAMGSGLISLLQVCPLDAAQSTEA